MTDESVVWPEQDEHRSCGFSLRHRFNSVCCYSLKLNIKSSIWRELLVSTSRRKIPLFGNFWADFRSACVCTWVCTSVSLNSMNQWLENRPAFCRVRDLLLLSHTTRRCGRRRTSWWTNTQCIFLIKLNSRSTCCISTWPTWDSLYPFHSFWWYLRFCFFRSCHFGVAWFPSEHLTIQ